MTLPTGGRRHAHPKADDGTTREHTQPTPDDPTTTPATGRTPDEGQVRDHDGRTAPSSAGDTEVNTPAPAGQGAGSTPDGTGPAAPVQPMHPIGANGTAATGANGTTPGTGTGTGATGGMPPAPSMPKGGNSGGKNAGGNASTGGSAGSNAAGNGTQGNTAGTAGASPMPAPTGAGQTPQPSMPTPTPAGAGAPGTPAGAQGTGGQAGMPTSSPQGAAAPTPNTGSAQGPGQATGQSQSQGHGGSGNGSRLSGFRAGANTFAKNAANHMPQFMRNGIARGIGGAANAGRAMAVGMRRFGHRVHATATSVVGFFVSPFGAISTILVILLMLLLTLNATYGTAGIQCPNGETPSAKPVESGGGGGGGGAIWNENAKVVARAFQKAGYAKGPTAAALGNFKQESGFSTTAVSSAGAMGLGQWLGGRLSAMRAYATSKGLAETDINAQAGYAVEVETTPPGGWGTAYGSLIKSKYPDVDTSGPEGLWRGWASVGSDEAGAAKGAFIWMAAWERPGMTEAAEQVRENAAKEYLGKLDEIGGEWAPDGSVPNVGNIQVPGGDSGEAKGNVVQAQCLLKKNAKAITGGVGDFPRGKGDYSWMGAVGVHANGDFGDLGNISGNYQCVWYAWTRLYMIHGKDKSTVAPYSGNGGDIWQTLSGKPGWEVDTTPHPGDGISSHTEPLAYTGGGVYAGHVAVVELVEDDPSGWKVTISEGNADGSGSFHGYSGGRTLTAAQVAGTDTHFFRNKAWAQQQ